MVQIDHHTLLNFLIYNEVKEDVCDHSNFLEWNNETVNLTENLIQIGEMQIDENSMHNDNYWGNDAPIYFDRYPYFGCDIYQCQKCKNVFFYYLELGGHGAQKRYRLVRKELVDFESIKPLVQILIDTKPFVYSVYKNPNLTYELHTYKSLAGGMVILHYLNENEKNGYLQSGIDSLKDRISDMDDNYNTYKVISWR